MAMDAERRFESGFSLIELILVLVLFAGLAMIAVPRLDGHIMGKSSLDAAAREIVGELRRCRSLAVSNAATNPEGFSLRLTNGDVNYEIVNLATSETLTIKEVPAGVELSGDDEFRFSPLGSLGNGSGSVLTLERGDDSVTVTVIAATGSVFIEED